MNNSDLYDKNFYETNRKDLNAAKIIVSYIIEHLHPTSVIDLGCGSGTWISEFNRQGIKDVLGIDGDYVNSEWQLIDKKYFKPFDLTKRINLGRKYDLAVSLEVAEHIDEKYSDIFLENITNLSDVILFSAAVPNQGGTNHVNEQYPTYWINKFKGYGYECYDCLRWKFWDNKEIAFWYRQNMMFYVKKDKFEHIKKCFEVGKSPINIVHPKRLENLSIEYDEYKKRTLDELKQKDDLVKQKEQEITDGLNKIEEKEHEIIDKQSIITRQEQELIDDKKTISEKEKEINSKNDLISEKEKEIIDKNNIIIKNEKELLDKKNIIIKNERLLSDVNKEFKEYKAKSEEEIFNMKKKNKEKDKLIDFLEDLNYPKVTVVVPVFNVAKFLRECLDSILNQTMKQIEVICGDGGSNDGSLEILREYEKKDPRVKVISKKGSGYGQSVNECMDMARGEYIGLVESDDKVAPDMYETLYYEAKKNDLDWIRSDIYFYYAEMPKNKQLSRESIVYGNNDLYNKILNPQFDTSPYNSALHTWAGIYKKDFLNKYHIRHHETPGGSYQDVGFYLRTLYYAKRVCFIENPFYYWRQDNPGSSIHYNSKSLVEKSKKEWELNKEYLLSSSNVTDMQWFSFNFRRYFSYQWTIDMAEGEDKEIFTEYAKRELKEAYDTNRISKDFFDESEWNKFLQFIN